MARRKSSYPFLSGDTFRDAADHLWENEIKILEPQNLNDGDEAAEVNETQDVDVVGLRVKEGTKKGYRGSVKYITAYCQTNIPNSTLDGELTLPMSKAVLMQFFTAMSRPRADGTVKAKASINGYISALKFHHEENNCRMTAECQDYLTKFSAGYKRLVAQKKADGVMKTYEGKVLITSSNIILAIGTIIALI
jgi:hypothetical protein